MAVLLFGFSFAQGVAGFTNTVGELCNGVKGLLPVVAMLMVVLAGVIYAAGQIMGAETRARANVWATACLTGALISVLIVVIAPTVLGAIYPGVGGCAGCQKVITESCGGDNGCCASGVCAGGTCQCTAVGSPVGDGTIPCCAGSHSDGTNCVAGAGCGAGQVVCGQGCAAAGKCCNNGAGCADGQTCQNDVCVDAAVNNLKCGGIDCGVPATGNVCCGNVCPCGAQMCVNGACRAAGNGELNAACGAVGDAQCGPNGELYSCNNNFCGGNGQGTATCGGAHDLACTGGNLVACNGIANKRCGGSGQLNAACGGTSDAACNAGAGLSCDDQNTKTCVAACINDLVTACQNNFAQGGNQHCCQGVPYCIPTGALGINPRCTGGQSAAGGYCNDAGDCSGGNQCTNFACVAACVGAGQMCQNDFGGGAQACCQGANQYCKPGGAHNLLPWTCGGHAGAGGFCNTPGDCISGNCQADNTCSGMAG